MMLLHLLLALSVVASSVEAQSSSATASIPEELPATPSPAPTATSTEESSVISTTTVSETTATSSTISSTSTAEDETEEESTATSTYAPPAFTNVDDPSAHNFLEDIQVGYVWEHYNYTDEYGDILPTNDTAFNLTSAYCETFHRDIYGTDEYYGVYRFFNTCIALANFTYDHHDGVVFPSDFQDQVLDYYDIPGNTPAALRLAKNLTVEAATFLHDTCTAINCARGIKDKYEESPCSYKNLYIQNNFGQKPYYNVMKDEPGSSRTTRPILNYENQLQCQVKICQRANDLTTDDPDIGGVGVFISYALQLVIAVILILCGTAEWFMCLWFHRTGKSYFRSEPFVNVVTNFHKTQVFFVGALVTAAFIKSRHHSVGTLDQFLLVAVAMNGMALVSFTLIPMYMISKRSWYIYFLSSVAFMLCLVFAAMGFARKEQTTLTYYNTMNFCYDVYRSNIEFLQNGGDYNKTTKVEDLFTNGGYWHFPRGLFTAIQVWCILIMLGVFAHLLQAHTWIPHVVHKTWRIYKRFLNALTAVVVLTIYGAIVGLNIKILIQFWRVIDHHSWGFGQIIAVTVWIPVFLDFFNDQYHDTRDKLMEGKYIDRNREAEPPMIPVAYEGHRISEESYYRKSAGTPDSEAEVEMRSPHPGKYSGPYQFVPTGPEYDRA